LTWLASANGRGIGSRWIETPEAFNHVREDHTMTITRKHRNALRPTLGETRLEDRLVLSALATVHPAVIVPSGNPYKPTTGLGAGFFVVQGNAIIRSGLHFTNPVYAAAAKPAVVAGPGGLLR
jgi:hypothetical protein